MHIFQPTTSKIPGSKAQLRSIIGEDNILRLQEYVTQDATADVTSTLKTAKASPFFGCGHIVYQRSRDDGRVLLDLKGEIRELGITGEDVASFVAALSTLDRVPVSSDNAVLKEHQRGTGVNDSLNGRVLRFSVSDLVPGGSEDPEVLGAVDWCILDIALALAIADEAKVISAGLTFLQIHRKERGLKILDGVIEESLLFPRYHCVDRGES